MSTLQQVAGAAGTALVITVMTRTRVEGAADGVDPVRALQDGIHASLLCGAVISLLAVAGSLLVRRPGHCLSPLGRRTERALEPPAGMTSRGQASGLTARSRSSAVWSSQSARSSPYRSRSAR